MTDPAERIQKLLAACGVGSRRQIERWVAEGRIQVNDTLATPGQKITTTDRVLFDGKPVQLVQATATRVIAYHKPVGELCTRYDPEGRPTIYTNLPKAGAGRWIGVGRLDLNSSGLVLLTTDGKLASALMHPSAGVSREYKVRVLGTVTDLILQKLREGVPLDDGMARFDAVEPQRSSGANRWFLCRLREGRNREVRRLWEKVGCQVSRLIRVRYGPVRLERALAPGSSRELDAREIQALRKAAGL